MREFNTFGPVYPDRHYHVNRITDLEEVNRVK